MYTGWESQDYKALATGQRVDFTMSISNETNDDHCDHNRELMTIALVVPICMVSYLQLPKCNIIASEEYSWEWGSKRSKCE